MKPHRSRARFALALSLGLAMSHAGAAGPDGLPLADARLPMLVIHPDHPAYPRTTPLAQGLTVVRLRFDEAGTVVDASIIQSSRNRDLDRRALQYFRRHGAAPEGTVLPATVDAPIRFAIDSDASVVRKTCAEFNADHAYGRAAEMAKEDPAAMRVFWLAMAAYAPDSGNSRDLSARMRGAAAATVDTCAANPSANFFEVFTSHLEAAR